MLIGDFNYKSMEAVFKEYLDLIDQINIAKLKLEDYKKSNKHLDFITYNLIYDNGTHPSNPCPNFYKVIYDTITPIKIKGFDSIESECRYHKMVYEMYKEGVIDIGVLKFGYLLDSLIGKEPVILYNYFKLIHDPKPQKVILKDGSIYCIEGLSTDSIKITKQWD